MIDDGATLLSVIITTFDSDAYLKSTLRSLAATGCLTAGWEVIVVDDGSDEALSIEESSARIVRLPENVGPAAARRAGAMQAHGRFILHIDAGDEVRPGIVESLSGAIVANPQADVFVFGYTVIRPGGACSEVHPEVPASGIEAAAAVLRGDLQGYLWNKVFRRSLYSESGAYCPPSIRIWEDKVICVELLAHASLVVSVREVLLTYFANLEGSLSETATPSGRIAALDEIDKFTRTFPKPQKLARALDTARLMLKLDCMWASDGDERRKYASMYREIDVVALDGTRVNPLWKLALTSTRFGSLSLFNALCLCSRLLKHRKGKQ